MLFKKCCSFYPNNKFCAVNKNYKYLQQYCTKYGNGTVKDFQKTRVKK